MKCKFFGAFMLAALAANFSSAEEAGFVKHPRLLNYPPLEFKVPVPERLALPGGAVAFFLEEPSVPQVSVTLWIRNGGAQDPADKAGLANLTAAAMRAGGTKVYAADDFNESLEKLAARISVNADKDYMTASLWTLSKEWGRTFPLFVSMLKEPAFDGALTEVERSKILEGVARVEDDPGALTRREYSRILYGTHPYGVPKEGAVESLARITPGDLRAFHAAQFRPADMVWAVSGKIRKQDFLRDVKRVLAAWPKSAVKRTPVPKVNPESQPTGVYYLEKPISQTNLRMGHFGLRRDDPRYFAVRVMNFILGEGSFSSRLTSRVRAKEGLAYSVGSRFAEMRDLGFFFAGTQTKAQSTKRALDLMIEEMNRLRKEPASDEELHTAKESLMNRLPFQFDNAAEVVNAYADLEVNDLPLTYYQTYRAKLQAVTKDDVLKAAKDYVRPDRMLFLVVGDEKKFDVPLDKWGMPIHKVGK